MARRIGAIISDLPAYGTDLITICCRSEMVIVDKEPMLLHSSHSQVSQLYGNDRWRNNYGHLRCTSCMRDTTSFEKHLRATVYTAKLFSDITRGYNYYLFLEQETHFGSDTAQFYRPCVELFSLRQN